jgi:SAM-dependent methyltransferase
VTTPCSQVLSEVTARLFERVRAIAARTPGARRLLDVGCWDGESTARYAAALNCAASGIEIQPEAADRAAARAIDVARIDLESEPFPWPDASMDVVVCNQVFEHLKNVWLPMSEIHRVLRPGGTLLLSVPNLGSLHNRLLLALGRQPTSIRTLGPHVRGYAFGEIRDFVALGGAFTIEHTHGVGFYPFPASITRPLCAVWPAASHTTIVEATRREGGRAPWREWIERELGEGLQTAYPETAAAPELQAR